ncbi:MAG: SDR family oxidoreductase [Alphaproteobacteria bacterium]|nr:SDR family oxidoreductase [Alphaproteobacteria bacterium]MBL7099919.1 SDR family oxidoreductase [Alphaproteobacteria bacterium]
MAEDRRIAVVTGGASGIGFGIAEALSGVDYEVILIGRTRAGLAPRGITANVIAPGFIADTGFTGAWPEERIAAIVAETPMGRAGTPADIAGAVLWLVSAAGSFVTGALIPVNGGWRIG